MLTFNLKPIFEARGITQPFKFLQKAGLSNHKAHRLLNGYNRNISLDVVEILCEVLICEPNDLIAYSPDQGKELKETHPLNNLRPLPEDESSIGFAIKNLSFKELKDITRKMKQQENKQPEDSNNLTS
ncbi:MAG: helix-turn-helix transcriptional regulator [Gelidibacter sp.]